jgi:Uma2 family endonuclease
VSEYWVVDLNNRALYVHLAPEAGRYASRQVFISTDRISAMFAPEVEFEVAELVV